MSAPCKAGMLCLALLVPVAVGYHARAASVTTAPRRDVRTTPPVITVLAPASGQALPAASPRAYVAARIAAHAPIARVELRLDGRAVPAEVMGPDDAHESVFYQPRHWSAGTHHILLNVWDADGRCARHAWLFRIGTARRSRLAPRYGPRGVRNGTCAACSRGMSLTIFT